MRAADSFDNLNRPKFLPDTADEVVLDLPRTDSTVNRLHRAWLRVPTPNLLVGITAVFTLMVGSAEFVENTFPDSSVEMPFKRLPLDETITVYKEELVQAETPKN